VATVLAGFVALLLGYLAGGLTATASHRWCAVCGVSLECPAHGAASPVRVPE
jgi:hypothetical protein